MADPISAAPDTLTRKALLGTSWFGIASVVRQVFSLICSAILGRILGPEAYGIMGMVALISIFLLNFRDMGTTTVVVQRKTISKRLLSTLFWVNCGLGLLLSFLVLCIAQPASYFFKEPRLTNILAVSSLSFLITSVGLVHNALLARNMDFGKLGITEMMSGFCGYMVAIPCAYAGFGVWSLVFANLTNSVVTTTLYWYFAGWLPSIEFDKEELKSVKSFSLNLSGFGLVNYCSRNADNLIVGKVLGGPALGFYQMAYNLMLYPIQNISSLISQVLQPAFSKIQDDDERFRSAYVRSCMLIGLFTFPIIVGMGILADPLIHALLGPKWVPSIILFQILAPVGFVQSLQTTVGQIYVAKARPDLMFRMGLCTTGVFVTSFLIGVNYGTAGVAGAYCIAYFGIAMYPVFAVPFRLIGLSIGHFARQLWPQLAITGVMGGCCFIWLKALDLEHISNPWLRLISGTLLGMILYITLLVRLRPAAVSYFEEIVAHAHSEVLRRFLKAIGLFPCLDGPEPIKPD